MSELSKDLEYKMMLKLNNQIDKWLAENYSCNIIEKFNKENRDLYLEKIDNILTDTDDLQLVSFILPNGKLKRLNFDLSKFEINDLYNIKLGINHQTINSRINIHHENIKYKGFELDDLLLAGCIRVGYNSIIKEMSFHYNPIYYKPNKKILDILDTFLFKLDTLYCSADYIKAITKKFNIQYGDTIKDIRRFINET